MEWTSLFFKMENKKVFVVGSGEVGLRRAERFLDCKSEVIIAGNSLPIELKEKGAILEEIDLKTNPTDRILMKLKNIVEWSDLVVIASENSYLNEKISLMAKDKLINRADFPEKGNIIVPTKFNIADIEISIYTNGKSPLMARELRKRLSNAITTEDILQIKLQDYLRDILKKKDLNQKQRRKILYEIFNNENIKKLIEEEKLEEAKKYIGENLSFIISSQGFYIE